MDVVIPPEEFPAVARNDSRHAESDSQAMVSLLDEMNSCVPYYYTDAGWTTDASLAQAEAHVYGFPASDPRRYHRHWFCTQCGEYNKYYRVLCTNQECRALRSAAALKKGDRINS